MGMTLYLVGSRGSLIGIKAAKLWSLPFKYN
jgi:hypothetical protein